MRAIPTRPLRQVLVQAQSRPRSLDLPCRYASGLRGGKPTGPNGHVGPNHRAPRHVSEHTEYKQDREDGVAAKKRDDRNKAYEDTTD